MPFYIGMLFYILTVTLGMLFYILLRLVSIHQGLAYYSISYHALAVSAKAWHAILYLSSPWQYLPRLGMLSWFYILSRLGSACWGLACCSVSYHSLLFCLRLPWQYQLKDQPAKIWATKALLNRRFFSRLSSLRFLNSDLLFACLCVV